MRTRKRRSRRRSSRRRDARAAAAERRRAARRPVGRQAVVVERRPPRPRLRGRRPRGRPRGVARGGGAVVAAALVLTYANEVGTAWVTNCCSHCARWNRAGAGGDAAAAALQRARDVDGAVIVCVVELADVGGGADANNPTRTLWFVRHHILPRLLATRRKKTVNVLLLDGDVTAQASPYPLLKGDGLRAQSGLPPRPCRALRRRQHRRGHTAKKCAAGGRASWGLRDGASRGGGVRRRRRRRRRRQRARSGRRATARGSRRGRTAAAPTGGCGRRRRIRRS